MDSGLLKVRGEAWKPKSLPDTPPHPAFPGVLGDGNWVAEIWVYYKLFFISDFKYLEPLLTGSNRDSSLIPTPNPGPSQEELLCPALG